MRRVPLIKKIGLLGLVFGALALVAGCAGDDGSDGFNGQNATNLPFFSGLSITPPSGPAGQFTIDTSGGAGATASGGSGGDFYAEIDYGSLGGNILLFKTGLADASFEFPAVTTNLGPNPLAATEDETLPVVTEEPDEGSPYTVLNNSNIYISDGDGDLADEDPVTGLSIAAGATVTLELNYTTRAVLRVSHDVVNNGTVTTALDGDGNRGDLELDCDVFSGTAGSMIDLRGTAGDLETAGGNGGYFDLDADDDDWSTYEEDVGAIFNQGSVNTSGGDGSSGGNAGYIYLEANLTAVNTGDLTARGGTGLAGAGGDGDWIEIDTDYGNNFNSGAFDASGGDGTTAGGDADGTYLYIAYPGDLLNSGDMTANGGSVTDAECTVTEGVTCAGGDGDTIDFYVYGGRIVNTGNLTATGGNGTTGNGGNGGDLDVGADYDNGWYGDYQPLGNFEFSGNINTSGGSGASGGDGGSVDFDLDAEYAPSQQQIILYGYTGVTTDGGAGATDGGSAGYFEMYNEYAYGDVFDYGPSGGVVNYATLSAVGGAGAAGSGGSGGQVYMETEEEYGYITDGEVAFNFGDLDLRGGAGTTDGGYGGDVLIWGYNEAGNQGAITTSGGSASANDGSGGDAGEVEIFSDLGPVTNSGLLTANGGDVTGDATEEGAAYAGHGAKIELTGYSVNNSGNLSAAGGNATVNETNTFGGDGELVFLYGVFDGTTNTATAIDVSGGLGDTAGDDGEIFVDSMNVTALF